MNDLLSGKKKIGTWALSLVMMALNHFVFQRPDPDLDKLIVALTAAYQAVEAVVDAARALGTRFKPPEAPKP